MLVDTVYGVVFDNQIRRRFGPHLRYTRNVVCRIALECFYLNKFQRGNAKCFLNILCVIIQNGCLSLLCLGNPNLYVLIGDLQKIPVARNQ